MLVYCVEAIQTALKPHNCGLTRIMHDSATPGTLAVFLKGAAHRTGNARAHGGRSDGACDAPQRIRRYPVDPSRPRASQPRAISFVTGPARGSGLSRGQACQCASRDEFLRSGFFSPCGRGGHGGVREKLSELDTSLSRRVMA